MSLHILFLYFSFSFYTVLAPTFNWIMQPLVHIPPKFAPIYLHFRPCLKLICMLHACYSGFRALYSGWFTPHYILCFFSSRLAKCQGRRHKWQTHTLSQLSGRVLLDIASVVHDQLLIRNHLEAPIKSPGGKRQSNDEGIGKIAELYERYSKIFCL